MLKNRKKNRASLDHAPVAKITVPGLNSTFLLSEIIENNQNIAFGICDAGTGEPFLGYFDLDVISNFKTTWGRAPERDPYFIALYPLRVYFDAAVNCGQLTFVESILAHFDEDLR